MGINARHSDTLGTGGSLVASLCGLGTPAILAFLAAFDALLPANDFVLLPHFALALAFRAERRAGHLKEMLFAYPTRASDIP